MYPNTTNTYSKGREEGGSVEGILGVLGKDLNGNHDRNNSNRTCISQRDMPFVSGCEFVESCTKKLFAVFAFVMLGRSTKED
jgi:hypothetical protein